jgi:hypothetical protein
MQAQRLPARHGALWLLASFRLFRSNPPLMTALTMGYMAAMVFINFLPLVGPIVLPLVLPLLTLVLANGCHAVERGQPAHPLRLAQGVKKNQVSLVRLGGLQLVGSLLILGINTVLESAFPLLEGIEQAAPDQIESGAMVAFMARLVIVAAPVLLAFWFAPLLVGWEDTPALKALFFSVIASLRNWRAFATYGLTVALVGVALPGLIIVIAALISPGFASALSFALRMMVIFVLAPTLAASVYVSYRDVFRSDLAPQEPPAADTTADA